MAVNKTELLAFLRAYRLRLERAWTRETASSSLGWHTGMPASTGQCSASSQLLCQDLSTWLPQEDFQLAIGEVISTKSGRRYIDRHVWVAWYRDGRLQTPYIIDLTADQSVEIGQDVVCEASDVLMDSKGIAYVAYSYFDPNDTKDSVKIRANVLSHNLERYEAICE